MTVTAALFQNPQGGKIKYSIIGFFCRKSAGTQTDRPAGFCGRKPVLKQQRISKVPVKTLQGLFLGQFLP
jgi:hypothetical protein